MTSKRLDQVVQSCIGNAAACMTLMPNQPHTTSATILSFLQLMSVHH